MRLYQFALLVCLPMFFLSGEKQELTLQVKNIQQPKGQVWIGVYNSEQNFLDKTKAIAVEGKVVDKNGTVSFKLDLPFGEYAIAVFHDINNNGVLDQTFIGIPKEPYAFSQKLKSKWRAPTYSDVKFQFNQAGQALSVSLEKW